MKPNVMANRTNKYKVYLLCQVIEKANGKAQNTPYCCPNILLTRGRRQGRHGWLNKKNKRKPLHKPIDDRQTKSLLDNFFFGEALDYFLPQKPDDKRICA